jgi:hypothetical protein
MTPQDLTIALNGTRMANHDRPCCPAHGGYDSHITEETCVAIEEAPRGWSVVAR